MAKQNSKKSKKRFFIRKKSSDEQKQVKIEKKLPQAQAKHQFPSIYRFITDRVGKISLKSIKHKLKTETFWIGILVLIIIAAILFVGIDLYKNVQEKQKVEAERGKITAEIEFWQKITKKYKGYRDAYFKIALLEYKLGDTQKSKEYLNEVFKLDPNFEKGRELEKILNN